jgi:hypothetical protein
MQTNRDLYLAICDLIERQRSASRDLESYLNALWQLGAEHKKEATFSLLQFFELLAAAFEADVRGFDEAWPEYVPGENGGYSGWELVIVSQIVDLREMRQAGTLDNDQRYFGVQSPRGGYWYNFDPCSYLECATAGSLGGWQDGDQSGRQYVPGDVAIITGDGSIETRDPRELENPVKPVPGISWNEFSEFLWCGQNYE